MRNGFFCASALCLLIVSCSTAEPPVEWTELPEQSVQSESVRVLLFGDFGVGNENQKTVAGGMRRQHQDSPFTFALLLGDNFYPAGVSGTKDPKFDSAFRSVYAAADFDFPFYVIVGNHDHAGNVQAEYDWVDPEGRWTAPGAGYLLPVVLQGGYRIDIYGIDSVLLAQAATGGTGAANGKFLLSQLNRSLNSRTADLVVLAVHYPPYSSGEHGDNRALDSLLRDIFEQGRVDIVVSGHEHDLELQSRDFDGEGVLFVVSGSAAKTRPMNQESVATRYASSHLGFACLEASATGSSVSFYNESGSLLFPLP